MVSVPLISLADTGPRELEQLDSACRDHGFFLLKDHGMDEAINEMWLCSARFFGQPREYKRRILRTDSLPLGYYDRELTKRKRDLKEVFDYMRPRDLGAGDDLNQWPESDVQFREAMTSFFSAATSSAARTLDLVYRALVRGREDLTGLPVGDARTSTVRLNHYPVNDPLQENERQDVVDPGDMALHHHTDPGILTLLVQDMTGGLQTLSRAEGWIDVPPASNTVVANLGDAMQVWSNDHYRAAVHRVVPMTAVNRFSTPFFFNPGRDAVLKPIPELSNDPAVYREFTWKEYIKGRVDDNYADLGEDDIQIDRFRL